jgi:hypothetical protein
MFWQDEVDTLEVETLEVCSWWSFRELWKEHYPHIRIHHPCNDTCGECTVFCNAFLYRKSRKQAQAKTDLYPELDDDDAHDDEDSDDEDEDVLPFKDDHIVGENSKNVLTRDCLEQEWILEAAGGTSPKPRECTSTCKRLCWLPLSVASKKCHPASAITPLSATMCRT